MHPAKTAMTSAAEHKGLELRPYFIPKVHLRDIINWVVNSGKKWGAHQDLGSLFQLRFWRMHSVLVAKERKKKKKKILPSAGSVYPIKELRSVKCFCALCLNTELCLKDQCFVPKKGNYSLHSAGCMQSPCLSFPSRSGTGRLLIPNLPLCCIVKLTPNSQQRLWRSRYKWWVGKVRYRRERERKQPAPLPCSNDPPSPIKHS